MTEKSSKTKRVRPKRVKCADCNRLFTQGIFSELICAECWLKSKGITPPSFSLGRSTAPIEPDMLRRLIQLCHPDRHGNSEAANTATRYLLALKGK